MPARRPGPQQIPRPPAARPGGPPPWAEWRGGPVTAERVAEVVGRAHLEDVPALAELPPRPGVSTRPSAVLVPIFDHEGEAHMVLTRRGSWMRSHTHQVAFPGGRIEDGEEPEDTALREAWEEVDLDPRSVTIAGQLTTLSTMSGAAVITPFVGVIDGGKPALTANPSEVERVFTVPFSELLDLDVFREEIWGFGEIERSVYFFEVDLDTIWGATARILFELLTLVTALA